MTSEQDETTAFENELYDQRRTSYLNIPDKMRAYQSEIREYAQERYLLGDPHFTQRAIDELNAWSLEKLASQTAAQDVNYAREKMEGVMKSLRLMK